MPPSARSDVGSSGNGRCVGGRDDVEEKRGKDRTQEVDCKPQVHAYENHQSPRPGSIISKFYKRDEPVELSDSLVQGTSRTREVLELVPEDF